MKPPKPLKRSDLYRRRAASRRALTLLVTALASVGGCRGCEDRNTSKTRQGDAAQTLTIGVYTTPREVYGKAILPAFRQHWRAKTGKTVEFRESYLGSGAQARAIAGGFEADVAALSLEADIDKIAAAGLIRNSWRSRAHQGMVSKSIVVIGVRRGNPKGIRDWQDLRRPDVEVLTPNPRTSGGALWNLAAIYGTVWRGKSTAEAGNAEAAKRFLGDVLRRVKIMDRSGRDSVLTFERGVGDAIITYENEILAGQAKGQSYEYIVPASTIVIENPVALVDAYVDKHKTRPLAQAFVDFLVTPEAQRAFAKGGYRPVDPSIAAETAKSFPSVSDAFTIRDIGGWDVVQKAIFAVSGR